MNWARARVCVIVGLLYLASGPGFDRYSSAARALCRPWVSLYFSINFNAFFHSTLSVSAADVLPDHAPSDIDIGTCATCCCKRGAKSQLLCLRCGNAQCVALPLEMQSIKMPIRYMAKP